MRKTLTTIEKKVDSYPATWICKFDNKPSEGEFKEKKKLLIDFLKAKHERKRNGNLFSFRYKFVKTGDPKKYFLKADLVPKAETGTAGDASRTTPPSPPPPKL